MRLDKQVVAGLVLMVAGALWLVADERDDVMPPLTGSWTLEVQSDQPDKAEFNMQYRGRGENGGWAGFSNWGRTIALNTLRGLTADQLNGPGTHVTFQRVGDAGTFDCEGWAGNQQASGHYKLALNPQFNAELKRRGFAETTPREQFHLAFSDFEFALVDELKAQRYAPYGTPELVRMGTHGVTLSYVREMKAAGYSFKDVATLIRMRDHGVTPRYIAELSAAGYKNMAAE